MGDHIRTYLNYIIENIFLQNDCNIMPWCSSHVTFINTFKCPYLSYLVLKFANVLLSSNQDMAQNLILQRSWPQIKINGTIRFIWPKKKVPDTKIVILSALVQKFRSKTSFLQTGGKCHIFMYVAHSNHLRCYLIYSKAPVQAIMWQLSKQNQIYGPKRDFIGLWHWKVKVIREG